MKMNKIRIMAGAVLSLMSVAGAQPSEKRRLQFALENENFKDARLMVLKNPELLRETINGQRPIHYVTGPGREEFKTLVFFVQKGARVNTIKDGIPLIHWAIHQDNYEGIKFLLQKGVDINYRYDYRGQAPIFSAFNDERMTKFLLSQKANINIQDDEGTTVLHWGARVGNKRFCEFLLSKGANRRIQNKEGYTPSEMARLQNNPIIADLLR